MHLLFQNEVVEVWLKTVEVIMSHSYCSMLNKDPMVVEQNSKYIYNIEVYSKSVYTMTVWDFQVT